MVEEVTDERRSRGSVLMPLSFLSLESSSLVAVTPKDFFQSGMYSNLIMQETEELAEQTPYGRIRVAIKIWPTGWG